MIPTGDETADFLLRQLRLLKRIGSPSQKEAAKKWETVVRREAAPATLLAAMLNRLGIKLTGEVNINHSAAAGGDMVVIPPDALGGFAAMRAEVAATNRLAALQAGGKN